MFRVLYKLSSIAGICLLLSILPSASAQPSAFQGFENAADLSCWSGSGTITRVPTTGGTLGKKSFEGSFHAEITDTHDAYSAGFGDSQFTQFCLPPSGYQGDFSQTIAVYIQANWPAAATSDPSFWIDEAPRDASGLTAHGASSIYTAEHNFRFTATGTSVKVAADDQPAFYTITTSGWYVFQMTWRKAASPTDPVLSDFKIWKAGSQISFTPILLATTTRPAFMVGTAPPLLSNNLGGPSYIWFTVWQNNFANDVIAIDNASVIGLGTPHFPPTCGWWFFY